jgi:hypothetical protein
MKNITLKLICLVALVCFLHACAVKAPNPASTAVPSNNFAVVAINNASTGTCPVNVWLDVTGPVTVSAGTVYLFKKVSSGDHTLTFNTTSTVSCGGPATCVFNNGGTTVTGEGCEFYVSQGQTVTSSITDNGCNVLSVTCAY